MTFTPPDDPYYTGEINTQHNGDLLIITIQTTTRINDEMLANYTHLESNPYLCQHLEINKNTGAIEKTYLGPYDL